MLINVVDGLSHNSLQLGHVTASAKYTQQLHVTRNVVVKEKLMSHRDYPQVVLDVNRSLKRFPSGEFSKKSSSSSMGVCY